MNYTIKISELAETLKKVDSAGYPAYVIINGEYYIIDFTENEGGKNDKNN